MVPEAGKNDKRHRFPNDGWMIITFVSFLIIPLLLSSCVGSPRSDPIVEAKKAIGLFNGKDFKDVRLNLIKLIIITDRSMVCE